MSFTCVLSVLTTYQTFIFTTHLRGVVCPRAVEGKCKWLNMSVCVCVSVKRVASSLNSSERPFRDHTWWRLQTSRERDAAISASNMGNRMVTIELPPIHKLLLLNCRPPIPSAIALEKQVDCAGVAWNRFRPPQKTFRAQSTRGLFSRGTPSILRGRS